jgi:hypothetical protein
MNISIIDINFKKEINEWFDIKHHKTIETNPNIIIEINIRILQRQLNQSNNYRIIETIFSNFNLFPQRNFTHFGIPISYQIANMNTIKTKEDLIRFQIRISEVGELL